MAYFVFKESSSPVKASSFISAQPRPTYAVSPTKPDQNMTNLRCTADHHAVPPLNIRPVESGLIPDHFSTGWKTYPAHHDLSERARPIPAVFQTNIRSPRSRPAHCRSVHFSRAWESGGWSGLWCERALKKVGYLAMDRYFGSRLICLL